MTEQVLVVLGLRMIPNSLMPATITTQWRNDRTPVYARLSPDELEAMGDDQTAVWEAVFEDGGYRLLNRVDGGALAEIENGNYDDEDVPF